ncbi:uncharacterized protein At1g03900-like isoform X2 [Coffea arabica]|uniref:Uncharacterized protein At1g03900-like isoform X2 n=1 Tax=Coffea arabica TaxID=13443 RepID=A0A6P6VP78_COFAR|nr:uncharacterized protein At1g03900-like isoform X1 [Coffea arabica]XP_027104814.1 uncharacterized protein At1g03900-like isoform X1 [Coffea arabica]XP_027104815.1 uncharacterized protein At1g03900-like isoform X1 [Coffea arabica]XP_027104816.1 uncharacterized protein At1g03900-like isoform X1 [Coffea arabica]XP_027104817.1 uncharacterized protein At1g03900-like isoform X1 [Coffea arabica]XP_027104818.1 uncharacterized protein At1g03900-like isoform X1 [Coffea arabica]XP_027104819.1 uncharac
MVMEGETIRINVKNKPPSGTGMLSPAGLLSGHPGTVKAKTLSIAPPPSGGVRIQSPLRPPLNDSAAAKMTLGRHNTTLKGPKEVARHSADPQADLSQLEKNLPTTTGTGSNKSTAAGWVVFFIMLAFDCWWFGSLSPVVFNKMRKIEKKIHN